MSRSNRDGRAFGVLCRLVLACAAFWSPSPWESRQQRRARERREAKHQASASSCAPVAVPSFEGKPLSKREKKRMKREEKSERRRLKKEARKARRGTAAPPSTPTEQLTAPPSVEGVLEADKEALERECFVDMEMTLIGTKRLKGTASELYLETKEALDVFDSEVQEEKKKNVTVRLSPIRVQILEAKEWGESVHYDHVCGDVMLFLHTCAIFGYVVKERRGKHKLIALKAPAKSNTANCGYHVPRIFEAFRNSGVILSEMEAPEEIASKKKPSKSGDPWGEDDHLPSAPSFCAAASTFTIRSDHAGSEFSLSSGSMSIDTSLSLGEVYKGRNIKMEPTSQERQPDTDSLEGMLSAPEMQPLCCERLAGPRPRAAHHRRARGRPCADSLPGAESKELESTTVMIPLPEGYQSRIGSLHGSSTIPVPDCRDDVIPETAKKEESFTLPGQVEEAHDDDAELEPTSTVDVLSNECLVQSSPTSAKSSTPCDPPSSTKPTPVRFERMPTFFTGVLPLSVSRGHDSGHSCSQHLDVGSDAITPGSASLSSDGLSGAESGDDDIGVSDSLSSDGLSSTDLESLSSDEVCSTESGGDLGVSESLTSDGHTCTENGDVGVPVTKCANQGHNATSWTVPQLDTDDDSDNVMIMMFQAKDFEDRCDVQNDGGYQNLQSSSF